MGKTKLALSNRVKRDIHQPEILTNRAITSKIKRSYHFVGNHLNHHKSYERIHKGNSSKALTQKERRTILGNALSSALSTLKIKKTACVMGYSAADSWASLREARPIE